MQSDIIERVARGILARVSDALDMLSETIVVIYCEYTVLVIKVNTDKGYQKAFFLKPDPLLLCFVSSWSWVGGAGGR